LMRSHNAPANGSSSDSAGSMAISSWCRLMSVKGSRCRGLFRWGGEIPTSPELAILEMRNHASHRRRVEQTLFRKDSAFAHTADGNSR
jgi:hypothetical protein